MIISAEMVLILTIVVIGVIVGLVQVRDAVVSELVDVGQAISGLNQSYGFTGFRGGSGACGFKTKSWVAGSSFFDINECPTVVNTGDLGTCPATDQR